MHRYPVPLRRGPEPLLARRVIIDLDGFDNGFINRVSHILEIDYYKDGALSEKFRKWIEFCIKDIVELFSMNPSTLYGTINIGPDFKYLADLGFIEEDYSDKQIDEFSIAYKALATNLYYTLTRRLQHLMDKTIDMGFSDMSCTVERYHLGMVILTVRALDEIK